MSLDPQDAPDSEKKKKGHVLCTHCNRWVKIPKKKRKPSAYNLFFAEQMKKESVKSLPPQERMKHIGLLWKAQKEGRDKQQVARTNRWVKVKRED